MLAVKAQDGGVSFSVRVVPRAARDQLGPVQEGVLSVRLSAPPVEGAANAALVKLLARALGVAKGRVQVVAGEHARQKRLWVEGLAPEDVARLLDP
ncbi:MAG: DUF167 domain-containing protein [Pseudomonadota bacterium]